MVTKTGIHERVLLDIGYHHAELEHSRLNNIRENANIVFFAESENASAVFCL